MTTAFDPITIGRHTLPNRIVMAPMTRSRAADGRPTELTATYYAQRASAGLIITEGIQPSVIGQGYPSTPGLHDPEQVAAWRAVTDAVHERGGRIFAQLMHTGRVGHPDNYADDLTPVGPSSVRADAQIFTPGGLQQMVQPEPLTHEEILTTIDDFVSAARHAIEAGFDGVELHGANGYLLHQFLSTNANQRGDQWGGSRENRARLIVDLSSAVAEAIGADRTAVRLSPGNGMNDIAEDDAEGTYLYVTEALDRLGLAYLHVLETGLPQLTKQLRAAWSGAFMLNPSTPGSSTGPDQLRLIEDGSADLLSFGALFLANPDLPARLAAGGPFNAPDMTKAYGGGDEGYTDYPTLQHTS
ncbi:alkene reductase [Aeromicrobium chenweiae]|uniref:Alkene reductase n=1 Tax=Aeromicrobium chenweiae TaxID=2079793 RepID=A0A2S0WJ11_9ACTN|nr:alkene reductase [Aeromicrobium chenweiae]AWB91287.1 alkene reductase [Aeromicrobium chenweiae]TGN31805.1 alkene reductase [Aeromicrobium chenweiae]